ncbi:transferase hexapeptide (six repeat-containing protein) [Lachnospiraceae bacterium]|nr:transferase hexapeptide (six repeat-containing protein) [Lachnospiraceae bacterium]
MKFIDRILNKIVSYRINHLIFPKELADKMPIYCSWHVDWTGIEKGSIEIDSDNIYKGMLQIGHDRIAKGLIGSKKSKINLEHNGKLIFKGPADLSQGISIYCHDNATLTIGRGIYTNGYCTIYSRKKVTIGNDNMWGWNVLLMDSDGHPIFDTDNKIINEPREINIGNNVWLASDSSIMKGVSIPDGCIVGKGSTVTGIYSEKNAILAGCPAKIIKRNITWNRGDYKI